MAFTTSQTPILNASDIDEAKENLRPLKQGRDVHSLASCLQLSEKGHGAMQEDIANQILGFEEQVKSTGGQDITIWRAYVKWLQQSPTDSNRVKLLDVLERAVMQFISDDQYKNDDRYLGLWLHYCSMLTDSTHIFKYLWNCKIGRERAMLYAGWAASLEERHHFTEAFEVYSYGISKRAEPLVQLTSKLERFQQRMQYRFHDHVGKDNLFLRECERKRHIMNPLSANEAHSRVRPTDQRAVPVQERAIGNANESKDKDVFEVYEDSEESSMGSFFENSTHWPTQFPGGYLKNLSENSNRAIKRWDKVRIKQRGVKQPDTTTSSCCFTVYTDPDVISPEQGVQKNKESEVSNPKLSKVAHRVLDYFSTLDIAPGSIAPIKPSRGIKEQHEKIDKKQNEKCVKGVRRVVAYNYNIMLQGPGYSEKIEGKCEDEVEAAKPPCNLCEWSFEEIRADYYRKKNMFTVESHETPTYPLSEDSELNSFWFDTESVLHDGEFGPDASQTIFNDAAKLFDSELTVFKPIKTKKKAFSERVRPAEEVGNLENGSSAENCFKCHEDNVERLANLKINKADAIFEVYEEPDANLKSCANNADFEVYEEPDTNLRSTECAKEINFEVYEEPDANLKSCANNVDFEVYEEPDTNLKSCANNAEFEVYEEPDANLKSCANNADFEVYEEPDTNLRSTECAKEINFEVYEEPDSSLKSTDRAKEIRKEPKNLKKANPFSSKIQRKTDAKMLSKLKNPGR